MWQTDWNGLAWLDALAGEGNALDLRGNGYPNRYTGQARHLLPPILAGPPEAREVWLLDPGDIIGEKWAGRTLIDHAAVKACRAHEWLLVEAWDESWLASPT